MLAGRNYAQTWYCTDYAAYNPPSATGKIDVEQGTGDDICNFTLTARPFTGHTFIKWSDGITTNPRVVTIDPAEDVSVTYTAVFAENPFIDAWKGDTIILSTQTLDLSAAEKVTIKTNGTERFTNVPLTSRGTGYWRLPASLNTYAGQTLKLEFYNSSSKLVAATDTVVPYVVTSDATLSSLSLADGTSVQVVSGKLTINATAKLGILDIYPGAKVSQTAALTVDAIYMRADGPLKQYPQFYSAASVTNNNSNIIYYDYALDYRHYYPLALPYTVACSKILTKAGKTPSYEVRWYDCDERARNISGWEVYNDAAVGAQITANQGYNVYAVPPIWGCSGSSRPKKVTLRFPMTANLSSSGDVKNKTVPISLHSNSGTHEPNKNWNLICSPYLANYTHTNDSKIAYGYYVKEGDTQVKYGDGQRYVTWSDTYFTTYTQDVVTSVALKPFFPYFVQIADLDGEGPFTLDFSSGTLASAAPRKAWMGTNESADNTEYLAGLILSQGEISDHTGLLYSEQFTYSYETNADLVKIFGEQQPMTIYSIGADNQPRAFNALPVEDAATIPVPLGYRNAPLGTMQIAFDAEQYDSSVFDAVWLTDHQTNTTVNLLDEAYTFTNTQEASDTRFSVTVAISMTPAVVTDNEATTVGGQAAAVYYDMLGRRVNVATAPKGVYIVVEGGNSRKEVIR